jgi:hypothetical protein
MAASSQEEFFANPMPIQNVQGKINVTICIPAASIAARGLINQRFGQHLLTVG